MACVQILRSLSKHPSPEDFMSIFNANVIPKPTSSIQISQLDKSIGKPSVTGSLNFTVLPRSVTIAPGTKLGAAKKALIQLVRDQQKRSFSQSIATSHISIHGTAIEETGVACALSTENSIFDTSGVNNKHFCSLEQSGDSSNNVCTTATNMRIGFSTLGANPIFILPPMHASSSVLLPASQLEMGLKSSLSTALTTRESHIAYPTEFSNLRRNNCIN